MTQSLVNEVNRRLSKEVAAGNPGALFTGHFQRVGNISKLATGTRRTPIHHWVPQGNVSAAWTIGESGGDRGYTSGYGALVPNVIPLSSGDVTISELRVRAADFMILELTGSVQAPGVTQFIVSTGVGPITCTWDAPNNDYRSPQGQGLYPLIENQVGSTFYIGIGPAP